ncbi:MAG: tetratricopeptide repeat protein, partial [Acidobacteriota bacterium]
PEIDPDARAALVEANLKRADELIRDGEIFSALQMLEQACAIEARPGALLKLAQLQLKNPKWDSKALRTLQKALEVDPDFIEVWLELADFWQRRGDTERRRKALEKVLSLDANNPKAKEGYAVLSGEGPLSRLRGLFRPKKR